MTDPDSSLLPNSQARAVFDALNDNGALHSLAMQRPDVTVPIIAAALQAPEQPNSAVKAYHSDTDSAEQANSDVLRAALKDKDDEIVRLEDMLSSRRDVTMERCDKCHRLYPIVDMVKYGDPDDVDAWHYLCAPCDYAEVKTHG